MPTPEPVEEINIAIETSREVVIANNTVLEKASELSDNIEKLSVPEEIKIQARDLVFFANESKAISERSEKAINELRPIVEKIAEEREKAIESEKVAVAQNRVLMSIITKAVIATGLILLALAVFWHKNCVPK